MKHYRLIWAGVWRNAMRTAYTGLSIFVAFLLFGLLHGITAAFGSAVSDANLDRLYVESKFGLAKGLPIAAMPRIEQVKGVTRVAFATWFGGSYQNAKQPVFAIATDPALYFPIYPELNLAPALLDALTKTRDGAVVNAAVAKRFGWNVGDRIPLRSSIWTRKADGSSVWSFEIVGTFTPAEGRRTRSELIFNQDYFDEARAFGHGSVGWFVAKIADPERSAALASTIDGLFANSPDETQTQNEQETAQSLLKQHGDINLIVNAIVGSVLFTILLMSGNTMMQSARERVPEFAVLKTLGYSTPTVAGIILSEALCICIVAALGGLFAAWLLFPLLQGVTGARHMPFTVIVQGLGIAVLLAAATGLPSAARLRRINVVDALAGR